MHTAQFKKKDLDFIIYIAWHPRTKRVLVQEGLTPDAYGMLAPLIFSNLLSSGWKLEGDADKWYANKIGIEYNSVAKVQSVFKKKLPGKSNESQVSPSETDGDVEDGGDSK